MTLPTRHVPTPLSLPVGQNVYTHLMPDTQTCRSFWSQPTCTCGSYALLWAAPACGAPLLRDGLEAIPMVPGNTQIAAMLHDAIDGPYRFLHDARHTTYVGVGPSTPDQPVVIHATPYVHLQGGERTRRLQGVSDSITFAVWLDPDRLVELDCTIPNAPTTHQSRKTRLGPVPIKPIALDETPPRYTSKRLVVVPETPPDVDAPVPEILAAIRQKADVHPELRDYIVIPESSVPEIARLPGWVVRSSLIDHIRIVKPRLDSDEPFGGEGEP